MSKTSEQLIAEEMAQHAEWEARTVAVKISGQDYTIADLRKVFEAVEDKTNWKNACAAFVPHQMVALTCAAIEYYHGAKAVVGHTQPITGKVLISSNGYAC